MTGRAVLVAVRSAACLLSMACAALAADYYVDVKGDDANPGTQAKPWRTLGRAMGEKAPGPGPGDTIWVRGGSYPEEVKAVRGGAPGKPLSLRAYGKEKPVLEGGGKLKIALHLGKGAKAAADHVVIEGLLITGYKDRGVFVDRRLDVTVRKVEVTRCYRGFWILGARRFRLQHSDVHHNVYNNVFVDGWGVPSVGIELSDSRFRHTEKMDNIRIHPPATHICARGEVDAVEPAGLGLARLTSSKIDFRKARRGTIIGQTPQGSEAVPSLILLFPGKADPRPDGKEIPGGKLKLWDARSWFVLRANPEWRGKPYSPDGRQALFEIGDAKIDDLRRAGFAYVCYQHDRRVSTIKDVKVLRNEVSWSGRQGLLIQGSHHVLVKDNDIHHNDTTGIQIENMSSHVWVEGNRCWANSYGRGQEAGIWIAGAEHAVVQNNRMYENQRGLGVTNSMWVLVRRNMIYNNRGQHVAPHVPSKRAAIKRSFTGGMWTRAGIHDMPETQVSVRNAFVHNTFYGNGDVKSRWGAVLHGIISRRHTRGMDTAFRNNLIQAHQGAWLLDVISERIALDGNLYHGPGKVRIQWRPGITLKDPQRGMKVYTISDPKGFAAFRKDTGQDAHSQFVEVKLVDPEKADFRPAARSPAVDAGVPLTVAASPGQGRRLPVTDVRFFSEGLTTSTGERLVPGDEIMIAGAAARIARIDRPRNVLILDRDMAWKRGDRVDDPYRGAAPDVGAVETGGR